MNMTKKKIEGLHKTWQGHKAVYARRIVVDLMYEINGEPRVVPTVVSINEQNDVIKVWWTKREDIEKNIDEEVRQTGYPTLIAVKEAVAEVLRTLDKQRVKRLTKSNS